MDRIEAFLNEKEEDHLPVAALLKTGRDDDDLPDEDAATESNVPALGEEDGAAKGNAIVIKRVIIS
jgi:hypothetical protein